MCGKTLKRGNAKHSNTKYHKKHAPIKYEELYKKHFETDRQKEINKILLDNTPLYQDIINVILEYDKEDDEKCIDELKLMESYLCGRRRRLNETTEEIIQFNILITNILKKQQIHYEAYFRKVGI
jgi:hypothetical protein